MARNEIGRLYFNIGQNESNTQFIVECNIL